METKKRAKLFNHLAVRKTNDNMYVVVGTIKKKLVMVGQPKTIEEEANEILKRVQRAESYSEKGNVWVR